MSYYTGRPGGSTRTVSRLFILYTQLFMMRDIDHYNFIGRAGKGMASIDTCYAVAAYNQVSERATSSCVQSARSAQLLTSQTVTTEPMRPPSYAERADVVLRI
jgi:hypothetical protein